jgi:putative NADH-flavin reductase
MKGIDVAFDIYTKNPEDKVILMSALPLEHIKEMQKNNNKLDFLLTQKNFRFVYLFDTEAFESFKQET